MVGYRNMKNITGSPSSRSPQSRLTENRIAVKVPHRSIYGYMVAWREKGSIFPRVYVRKVTLREAFAK